MPARENSLRMGFGRLLDDTGASLIEFAVSASVLFLALLGIVEMCFALYIYDYVSDAARVGTRFAIVRGSGCKVVTPCNATQSDIQNYLQSMHYPGMNPLSLNAAVTWYQVNTTGARSWTTCGNVQCDAPQNEVQVTVTYPFPLQIPYFPGGTINIQSTSQMVIVN